MTVSPVNTAFEPKAFWEYSLTTYAKTGVKELCLRLQDKWDYNVNVLLFCGWLQMQNLALSAGDLTHLLQAIASSDLNIKSHRKMRRSLAKDDAEYRRLLAQELELEAEQQRILVLQLNEMALSAADKAEFSNLQRYAQLMPESSRKDCRALDSFL